VTDNTIRGATRTLELTPRHLQSESVAPSSANAQVVWRCGGGRQPASTQRLFSQVL